ncbi:MAG: prohibitin family protein [Candidatus Coatesbacteria bacterium]|nr:MAG: prohibitin family protein [Candidatus Coatesbacteria bacterium]
MFLFVLSVLSFVGAIALFIFGKAVGAKGPFRALPVIALGAGCLFLLFSSLVVIPPGHVGVPVIFGAVSETVYGSGLHFKWPVAIVVKMSIQERAYTMGVSGEVDPTSREFDVITALTNEGMKVDIDITVQYSIMPEKTPWILNNKVWANETQFERNYVRPEIRRAIRDVCARYSAQQLYSTKRGEVGDEIRKLADGLLAKNGCSCVAVNLRNVMLPETVTAAIERKKEREQQSQEYDYKLEVEAKEADRKRIEAAGIRDFQITVSEGISPMLIQWKGIEAAEKISESPNAKVVIFGDSKVPVILGGQ